jgi:preprotein translocase subunit SecE
VADKEEVDPAAEPSSAELPGASQTGADHQGSHAEPNGTAINGSEAAKEDGSSDSDSGKVLEPAGVAAVASGASAKTGTRSSARAPKGVPTNKRDQPVKPERTTPLKFVRQSIGELRKVVYPTGPQLINYFVVVLVFVLFVIAIVSLLDLGFGWVIFKIFS